jgi:diguanylate cyclase (GGDEF)-like protein
MLLLNRPQRTASGKFAKRGRKETAQMDMRTLLVERACLLTFCTLLVLANVRENRGMPGLRWFAASNVNYFVGGILIASRDHVPVWASVVLANFLYSMGYVFLHRCLSLFFSQRPLYWWAQCSVAALSLAQCVFFTLIHPDIRYRLAAIGFATGLQFAICAMVAFHGAEKKTMRHAAIGMGSVLAFSAALNLSRVALTLVWGTTKSYLHADQIQTMIVMLNTMVFVAIDIAFVWMIATTLRNELHTQAMTDPLTRVLNRRALELMAERAIQRSRQMGQPLSAIAIDLDSFKEINDSRGHRTGDMTLVSAARCLESGLRDSDSIARVGGDEFVIMLPDCSRSSAQVIAERLRVALESQKIMVGEEWIEIRASFGVATLEEFMPDWDGLIAECDRALYSAKSVGGNFVHVT